MKQQSYKNHIQFYPLHHFVFYPVLLILIAACIRGIFKDPEHSFEYKALTGVFIIITWLSLMLRQHYALINQNRTVRLEMRLRYFQLTGQRLEAIENQLSFGQLAALRFAPDEELLPLVQRTLAEHLSPKDIKISIKNWMPDYMRV